MRRCSLMVCLLVGFLKVVPGGVAADGSWLRVPAGATSPNLSGTDDGNSVRPAAAVSDPAGRTYIAWSGAAGTTSDIFMRVFDPATGAWTDIGNISDTADVHSLAPRLIIDDTGDLWVTWQEGETLDTEKMISDIQTAADAIKAIVNPAERIDLPGDNVAKVNDIIDALTTLVDTFAVMTPPAYVYLRKYDPDARSWDAAVKISDNGPESFAGRPDIGLYDGNPFVVWEYVRADYTDQLGEKYTSLRDDPLNNLGEIRGKRWTGSAWQGLGGSETGTGISGSGLDIPALAPRIVARTDGRPVVVWQETLFKFSFSTLTAAADLVEVENMISSGYFAQPQAHLRYWGGSAWDALDTSADDTAGGLSQLSGLAVGGIDITAGTNNALSVVYQGTNPTGPTIQIYGRQWRETSPGLFQWTDNGGAWHNLSASPFGYALTPSIVTMRNDRPVVTWSDGMVSIFAKAWNGTAWEELGNSAYGGGTALIDLLSEISFHVDGETVVYGLHARPDIVKVPNGNPMIVWQEQALPPETLAQIEETDFTDPAEAAAALQKILAAAETAEYDIWMKVFNQAPAVAITTPDTDLLVDPATTVDFIAAGSDPDTDRITWLWGFRDGATADISNPSHRFDTAGIYDVSVTVSDPFGATDTATRQVKVSHRPVATIDKPPLVGAAQDPDITVLHGQSVNFAGSWTDADSPNPGDMTFLWTFGTLGKPAGGQHLQQNPGDVVYELPDQITQGVATVTFTVTDEYNVASIPDTRIVKVVKNAARPTAAITATAPDNSEITAAGGDLGPPPSLTILLGEAITFAGTATDSDNAINRYAWSFTDSGGANPLTAAVEDPGSVTYATAGTHVVTFTSRDDDGLLSLPAIVHIVVLDPSDKPTISVTPAEVVLPQHSTFDPVNTPKQGVDASDFEGTDITADIVIGGADAVDTAVPGSYSVTYDVTDGNGLDADQKTRTYIVDAYPNGEIVATGPDGTEYRTDARAVPVIKVTVNEQVRFAGTPSDPDPGPGGLLYAWDFDDASPDTSEQEDPGAATFDQAGTQTVTFTVVDGYGLADPTPAEITVEVGGQRPVAEILDPPGDLTISTGDSIDFTGNATDADGDIATWSWILNDQVLDHPDAVVPPASDQQNPAAVAFREPGVYQVQLFVTDTSGLTSLPSDDASVTITVVGGNRPRITVAPTAVYIEEGAPALAADDLMQGVAATDQEDGNLTGSVTVTGGVNTALAGQYPVAYDVTDSSGLDADTQFRTYHVIAPDSDDGDDIPDAWEEAFFGDGNAGNQDGDDDSDGDGKTNQQEYDDGTNPAAPTLHLYPGWNLAAWPRTVANREDATLTAQLAGVHRGPKVWGWDPDRRRFFALGDHPTREAYMTPTNGYWVWSWQEAIIEIAGDSPPDATRPVVEGWNLIAPVQAIAYPTAPAGIAVVWGWLDDQQRYDRPDILDNTSGFWYLMRDATLPVPVR